MRPITPRQKAALDFVRDYVSSNGFPPTLREIGNALGLDNVSAVRGHLAALEKKGYLAKDPDKARSIRLVSRPSLISRLKKRLHEFARTDEGVLHQVVYGIALVTNGRKPWLVDSIRPLLDDALDKRAREHGWQFLRKRIEDDHILLVVKVWPNHSPEAVVSRIRHCSSPVLRKLHREGHVRRVWAKGYVATTDLTVLDHMMEQLLQEAALRPNPRQEVTEAELPEE